MKKIISILLVLLMSMSAFSISSFAQEDESVYAVGTYYQLGKYNDKPILWRCISTDGENGILLVSDKILCFKVANAGENNQSSSKDKIYGSNFWEESTIRTWLNSTASAGEVEWINYPPDIEHINTSRYANKEANYPYADEAGFLSSDNFTDAERSVMKTVSQWQDLPINKLNLATNGYDYPYITGYSTVLAQPDAGSAYDGGHLIDVVGTVTTKEYKDSYIGAMYRISDTIFLLNPPQLQDVYNCYGTLEAEVTETPLPDTDLNSKYDGYSYWLRSQYYNTVNHYFAENNECIFIAAYSKGLRVFYFSETECGIRPAFYLNEDNALITSGSGTADDPYVLNGSEPQESVAVFSNGSQLQLDQQPINENDRLLVPMRAIFESLGADVTWYEDSRAIVAKNSDTTVYMEIDGSYMSKNDEWIALDVPPRLVGDRTLVPVRAVSEALDARVDWIEDLQRVVVDSNLEWTESDWNPEWYQQALKDNDWIRPKK